ncbi:MAG: hypothetical protein ABI779_25805 [Acidobacteriota bacterium]
MRARPRVLWLLATIHLLSCGRFTPDSLHPEPVARVLAAKPHRLAVVFWPQFSGCDSCDQMISAVIAEWQAVPNAEMAVVSVIPAGGRTPGRWLPGAVIRLTPEDYARRAKVAPLPRVEIWSADNVLLMSRSVPNYGSQAELLNEEMLAARSFTAPIVVASRTGASR